MKRFLTSIFFLSVGYISIGQVVNYDVIRGSKKLGEMTVKRTALEHQTFYKIESKVTFRLLLSFTVLYECTSEYKYGQLIKEYTHNRLNGTTQKKSTIWFDGEKYTLDLNSTRYQEEGVISYSVAAIFYQEPIDGQKVYSPQFGRYLTFKKVGDHSYEMLSPDGLNVYSYTNGICTEVKVNRDFAKFSFVMTPESLASVKEKKIIGGAGVVD